MTAFTFTPAEDADPALVAAYQVRLAKLKPACSRCGHPLPKRDLELGRCSNRGDCLLRQIFAGPKFPDGKALNLAEVHALHPAARNGRHNEGGTMSKQDAPASPAKETARMVAVDILRGKGGGPIKVGELAKLVVASGRTKLTGKTPEATVSAHIYTAAKKGELFRKTDRGEVALLDSEPAAAPKRGRQAAAKKEPAAKKEAAPKKPAAKKTSGRARRSKAVPTDDVAAQDKIARGDELPEPSGDGERPSEAAMRMADEELAAQAAAAAAKQKEGEPVA